MFATYNMVEFGKALKQIRLNCRLTQAEVRQMSGVHEDTLRKLENGTNVPKYETLEILSNLYKSDLLEILKSKRIENRLYDYYQQMDKLLISYNIAELESFCEAFETSTQTERMEKYLLNNLEFTQLQCFIQCCKLLYSENPNRFNLIQSMIESQICPHLGEFDPNALQGAQYNDIEIRLIFMLGTIQLETAHYERCATLLTFVIDYLCSNLTLNPQTYLLILKAYTNLSYCYHLLKDYEQSLNLACKGIAFGVEHKTFYMLQHLYGRKAVAELHLKTGTHMDAFKKCIHLFEISGQFDLAKTYKEVTLSKYGIDLYNL